MTHEIKRGYIDLHYIVKGDKETRSIWRNFKRRLIIFSPFFDLVKEYLLIQNQFRLIFMVFKVRHLPCWDDSILQDKNLIQPF